MKPRFGRGAFGAFGALVALVALAGACGGGSTGPVGTLDAYSEALRNKNYAAAYELMSAEFRDQYPKEEFVRMMRESEREASDTAQRLKHGRRELEVTAEFQYGLGETMRLVREDDEWKIASNPVLFYSQATPRDALRSFVRAYHLRRWDIMLQLVPDQYRERMDVNKLEQQFTGAHREEIDVMMNMLEANMDQPIQDKGREARMPYGERFEVVFVREGGLWKIQDID